MGKQDIIKYVMETPHNTNPKLLKQKIEDNFTWDEIANNPFHEEAILQMLVDTDMFPAVYNADSKVLTDEAGRIVLRY